jgi:hypothetical protein
MRPVLGQRIATMCTCTRMCELTSIEHSGAVAVYHKLKYIHKIDFSHTIGCL